MPTPKLKVSHLGKRFGDLDALRGIDLTIERGEFISVVGPSGCGKTAIRIIAGLGNDLGRSAVGRPHRA